MTRDEILLGIARRIFFGDDDVFEGYMAVDDCGPESDMVRRLTIDGYLWGVTDEEAALLRGEWKETNE